MPNSAIYAEQLKLFVSQQPTDDATTFEHLWGVFSGAYDDFKAGMFDNLKLEIESSVSCDFLGQANALLNDKELVDYSYLPAAVLIGAVLEKTLRSLCENANPKIETVNPTFHVRNESQRFARAFVSFLELSNKGLHYTPADAVCAASELTFGGGCAGSVSPSWFKRILTSSFGST